MFFQKKFILPTLSQWIGLGRSKADFEKKCEMVNLPIIGHSKKISKNNKLFSERVNKNL